MRKIIKASHNLFHYANRELSHSAFWAWILGCTTSDDESNSVVKELGKQFLRNIGSDSHGDIVKVGTESIPFKTDGKVRDRFDVWAQFADGSLLVIENKVLSLLSNEQLQHYDDLLKGRHATKVYLNAEFSILSPISEDWISFRAEDIRKLFEAISYDRHPLLNDYYHWMNANISEWNQIRESLWSSNVTSVQLQHALAGRIGRCLLLTGIFREQGYFRFNEGFNKSGSTWVSADFFELDLDHADKSKYPECLYYRVDGSVKGPYLSFRQYLKIDGSTKLSQEKKEQCKISREKNFEFLRRTWTQIIGEVEKTPGFKLYPAKPRNRGNYMREIGWFVISSDRNRPVDLQKWLPELHNRLCGRLVEYGYPLNDKPQQDR